MTTKLSLSRRECQRFAALHIMSQAALGNVQNDRLKRMRDNEELARQNASLKSVVKNLGANLAHANAHVVDLEEALANTVAALHASNKAAVDARLKIEEVTKLAEGMGNNNEIFLKHLADAKRQTRDLRIVLGQHVIERDQLKEQLEKMRAESSARIAQLKNDEEVVLQQIAAAPTAPSTPQQSPPRVVVHTTIRRFFKRRGMPSPVPLGKRGRRVPDKFKAHHN